MITRFAKPAGVSPAGSMNVYFSVRISRYRLAQLVQVIRSQRSPGALRTMAQRFFRCVDVTARRWR
jgi:hypothetical protein